MKDADLKRNASGYYDVTAYKAITAAPNPGEIWQQKKTGFYMLVLGGNEKVTSCLKLNKNVINHDWLIPVTVGEKVLYTDPVMIGYTFTDKLDCYVTKLTAAQLASVHKAIGKALGITAVSAVPYDHINALERRNAELLEERDKLIIDRDTILNEAKTVKFDLDARNMACDALDAQCTAMSAELDKANVYKEMYLQLVDKLVSARGGAAND